MKDTTNGQIMGGIAVLLIIIGLGYWYMYKDVTTVLYTCENNKNIIAEFNPKNDSKVELDLSDGRDFNLKRVVSASGARYANADESIVFWNKGDTAFLTEGSSTTFANCALDTGVTPNTIDDTQATTTETGSNATGGTGAISGSTTGGAVATDGMYGYANSEYNFTMRFPPTVRTSNVFPTFYQLPSNWRVNASQANQGKPVVDFLIRQIDQGSVATGKAYPLYFTAQVRVGVSPNVALCYEKDAGHTNQTVTNVVINGVTWKKFSFSNAAMMKYIQGESYRTIHNNLCYVMEQVKAGTTYTDETMKVGTTEATLNGYYNSGATIIKTFKFTK